MSTLTAMQVGDITGKHIGRRTVVLDGKTACEGILTSVWFSQAYGGETIARVTIKTEMGELKLANLPMDYLFQIEDEGQE